MIAVLAPYRPCEATWAALAVADSVLAACSDVRILSWGAPDLGLHPFWDRRVRRLRDPKAALRSCTAIVHFQPAQRVLDAAAHVAPRARHVLVLRTAELQNPLSHYVDDYDYLVSPTSDGLKQLHAGRGPVQGGKLGWSQFDGGPAPVHRRGPRRPGQISLCVVAGRDTVTRGGPFLEELLLLLGALPELHVQLLSTRSWANGLRRLLRRLVSGYPGRFVFGKYRGLDQLTTAFQTSDWSLFAGTAWEFGTLAARSLACGTPVLAHRIPPFAELLTDGYSGVLLDCEHTGGSQYRFLRGSIYPACSHVLRDSFVLERLLRHDWRRRPAQLVFQKFWSDILELRR